MYKTMLQPDLIGLDFQETNQLNLFQSVSKILLLKGYVRETYLESLIERERQFPTGLQTRYLNIALPHTDPEVINHPFIFVVRNSQQITMLQMGDNSETPCRHFLFLGIKDPKSQVGLLAKLMDLFSKEDFVTHFAQIDDEVAMYQLLSSHL